MKTSTSAGLMMRGRPARASAPAAGRCSGVSMHLLRCQPKQVRSMSAWQAGKKSLGWPVQGWARQVRSRGPWRKGCCRMWLSRRAGGLTTGRRTGRRRLSALVAVTALALTTGIAGGVLAADPGELLGAKRPPGNPGIERRIDALLTQMTLDDKLQQLSLLADFQATDDAVRKGAGSVFGVTDPARINALQHIAVEQTRLHIPVLFAFDTIHGFRTVFPIPLAEASSFDPEVAATDFRIGARESAAVGLKQIYSPMVDISNEPRWGRIAEGAGEDPYLGSVMAA